jgi:hypothetical protein
MLFDLATDPGETRNLAADAELAGDLAELRGAMRDQRLRGIPDLPRFESRSRER